MQEEEEAEEKEEELVVLGFNDRKPLTASFPVLLVCLFFPVALSTCPCLRRAVETLFPRPRPPWLSLPLQITSYLSSLRSLSTEKLLREDSLPLWHCARVFTSAAEDETKQKPFVFGRERFWSTSAASARHRGPFKIFILYSDRDRITATFYADPLRLADAWRL